MSLAREPIPAVRPLRAQQDLLAARVVERRCRLLELVAEDSAHDHTAVAMDAQPPLKILIPVRGDCLAILLLPGVDLHNRLA